MKGYLPSVAGTSLWSRVHARSEPGGERPHDGRRRELLLAAHDGDAVGVGEVERDAGDVLVLRVVAPLPLRHHRVAARLVGEVPLLPAPSFPFGEPITSSLSVSLEQKTAVRHCGTAAHQ